MTDEAPRYPIATLLDMARVPEEALPRLLAELPAMLAVLRQVMAINDAAGAMLIQPGATVWVDDGRDEICTHTTISGKEQGR